jgi:hypothetical protein
MSLALRLPRSQTPKLPHNVVDVVDAAPVVDAEVEAAP